MLAAIERLREENARLSAPEAFRQDLRRALELGPNATATLITLYPHVGAIGAWLDLDLAEQILALGERTGRFQSARVIAIMRRFGWLELCWLASFSALRLAARSSFSLASYVPSSFIVASDLVFAYVIRSGLS